MRCNRGALVPVFLGEERMHISYEAAAAFGRDFASPRPVVTRLSSVLARNANALYLRPPLPLLGRSFGLPDEVGGRFNSCKQFLFVSLGSQSAQIVPLSCRLVRGQGLHND